jgi:hypothetical protein
MLGVHVCCQVYARMIRDRRNERPCSNAFNVLPRQKLKRVRMPVSIVTQRRRLICPMHPTGRIRKRPPQFCRLLFWGCQFYKTIPVTRQGWGKESLSDSEALCCASVLRHYAPHSLEPIQLAKHQAILNLTHEDIDARFT